MKEKRYAIGIVILVIVFSIPFVESYIAERCGWRIGKWFVLFEIIAALILIKLFSGKEH